MIVAAFIEIIMAVNVKAENDTKSIFGSNANISTGERVYSSDKSISIFAPKGWIVDSNPAQKGVKLFIQSPKENSNDKFQELVYINEDFLPNTTSLDYYIKYTLSQMKNMYANFSLEKESDDEVNMHKAKKFIMSFDMYGVRGKSISYVTENNRTAYAIQAWMLESTYESWHAQMDQICQSVRFH